MKTLSLVLVLAAMPVAAQQATAPAHPGDDERYKADILLVVAHPDDETGDIAAYLARAIYEEHRRVAVICITRGDGGGNAVGNTRAAALGAEREMEGREALAFLGVKNVWFLGAPDTPAQDVLRSLEHWDHGSALAQIVRLVRLTRPEVILTWLPLYVAGENHADHQAASVIATEAFDLAGDPTAFAEQLSAGRDDLDFNTEGLHAWQPQKLYYYSDAYDAGGYWLRNPPIPSPFRKNFLEGAGPQYAATDVSPSQHRSYAQIAAKEVSFYLTQDGMIGKTALESGDFKKFEFPTRLVFGKSLVGGSVTGDVFEAVVARPVPFAPTRGLQEQARRGLSLEFGGSWEFYPKFWKAHNIERLAQLLPVPEVSVRAGGRLHIPLIVRNDTGISREVRLMPVLPDGWRDDTKYQTLPVASGDSYPLMASLSVAETEKNGWREVTWAAEADGQQVGVVTLRVCVVARNDDAGLAQ